MEKKNNNIIKIIIAIILILAIIGIVIFITIKISDKGNSDNTTNKNETDPRIEYIKEPTATGVPGTDMPVINDIPTE